MKQRDSSIPGFTPLCELGSQEPGKRVAFRARVHHIRPLGSRIVFFVFRGQLTTVQGILTQNQSSSSQYSNGDARHESDTPMVSENMIRWAEGLARESVVRVVGVIQHPPEEEGQHEVKSTSVKDIEVRIEMVRPLVFFNVLSCVAHYISSLRIYITLIDLSTNCSTTQLHVISSPTSNLPFQVDDVSHTQHDHHVGDKTRFMNRVLDLRVRFQLPLSHDAA